MSTVWQTMRNVAFLQHCSIESKPRSTVNLLAGPVHWQLFQRVPLRYQNRTPKQLKYSYLRAIDFSSALACLWATPIRQRPHLCCSQCRGDLTAAEQGFQLCPWTREVFQALPCLHTKMRTGLHYVLKWIHKQQRKQLRWSEIPWLILYFLMSVGQRCGMESMWDASHVIMSSLPRSRAQWFGIAL